MRTLNKSYIHKVAKELDTTVEKMRVRYRGYALICGFDSLDDYLEDDRKRGFKPAQSANILRQGC